MTQMLARLAETKIEEDALLSKFLEHYRREIMAGRERIYRHVLSHIMKGIPGGGTVEAIWGQNLLEALGDDSWALRALATLGTRAGDILPAEVARSWLEDEGYDLQELLKVCGRFNERTGFVLLVPLDDVLLLRV